MNVNNNWFGALLLQSEGSGNCLKPILRPVRQLQLKLVSAEFHTHHVACGIMHGAKCMDESAVVQIA